MVARPSTRVLAPLTVVLVLLGALLVLVDDGGTRTVTAHFDRTVGLYVGNEVRILGVPVGEVTAVVPEGNSVRVEMEYDDRHSVPSDAQAVIVSPTLVADRFVQLTPAFTDGDEPMADGAEIPLRRTAAPVELDRVYRSLDELSVALGPNGVNADGSLDTLLAAGTKTLRGKGGQGNAMIRDLSAAVGTMGEGSDELFGTVRELQLFVDTLARNDRLVRRFVQDMAGVSGQLAGEREELGAALTHLSRAVGRVDRFVRSNRQVVRDDVEALADVTSAVVEEQESLATALEKGPVGAGNLAIAFDNSTGAIGARIQTGPNIDDVSGFLCAIVQNANIPSKDRACRLFDEIFDPLPSSDPELQGRPGVGTPSGTVSRTYQRSGPARTLRELLGGAP